MSKEKVVEIKINEVTYIVSEVNRNNDQLKEIIMNILIGISNDYTKCIVFSFVLFYNINGDICVF